MADLKLQFMLRVIRPIYLAVMKPFAVDSYPVPDIYLEGGKVGFNLFPNFCNLLFL